VAGGGTANRDGGSRWRKAVGGSAWRSVDGGWRLAVGGWRLAVGGWRSREWRPRWRLAVGGWMRVHRRRLAAGAPTFSGDPDLIRCRPASCAGATESGFGNGFGGSRLRADEG